ncbi:hemolysin III family channel protein [Nitzschia inconspicua]|uniref:Hemolysin III family channel protein n=1 Tax=Nitzschia inconspicua TaxID=303405 RepID=A0A9K3KRN4_9STRA|nr:hemolysin III family channel protein [Nitzschia inconspicua]
MVDSESEPLVGDGSDNNKTPASNENAMPSRSSNNGDDGASESFCFENFPPTSDSSDAASATRDMMSMSLRRRPPKTRSLSMRFIKSLSGLGCENCQSDPFHELGHSSKDKDGVSSNIGNETTDRTYDSVNGDLYNLKALQRSLSTISPLVSAPMMLSPPTASNGVASTETIIGEYMCFCRFYKVTYNAGILTTLRFSLPCMRVTGPFHDEDMLALVEMLLRHGNGALKYISRLDFSIASKEGRHWRNTKLVGFTSHGALALAKALQTTKYVRQVFLPRHRVGPYGAAALFLACRTNPSIEVLNLRRCRIGERGAYAFCEIIMGMNPTDGGSTDKEGTGHGLVDVDLSANRIGHQGTAAIEKALEKHLVDGNEESIYVNLEGNLVFPEIMNGITHGLGVLLCLLGGHLLSQRVRHQSYIHAISCGVYTCSLLALYVSSTLYHSFFTLLNTRYIFRVMDKCAIYILIAGSYTPFLQILMSDQPKFSYGLLGFLWICGGMGIFVEATYPNWKWKGTFSLTMYLGMGWAAILCLPQMQQRLPSECIHLVVLGGVAYTAGVPFFVRDNNLDHAIWHLFVISGSILHWLAVFIYVAPKPLMAHQALSG